jgi:hypothetical protein
MSFLRRIRRRAVHTPHLIETDVLIDQRGIPTHACLSCGCNVFLIHATFEEYDIAGWYLDGTCSCCGSPLTAPCPVDDPATW